MIRVFIGFDTVETVSYHVLSHSIQARCSEPVSITPLMLTQLSGLMTREHHNLQSTEFSFSRFLVPHLCDYQGWALFMGCGMLVLDDMAGLLQVDALGGRVRGQETRHIGELRRRTQPAHGQPTLFRHIC